MAGSQARGAAAAVMSGWPHLAPLRWTADERRRHYAEDSWASEDLWRLLERNAARYPAREAYADRDERLTFADLLRRAGAVALGLRERGVGTGDVVAVQLPNSVEYAVLRFAVSGVGGVLLSLPPDSEPVIVADLVARTGAQVYVAGAAVSPAIRTALGDDAVVVGVGAGLPEAELLDRLAANPAGPGELAGGDADAVDLLMGTSGTTGTPKLVMRTANSFLAMSRAVVDRIGLASDDTLMIAAPAAQGIGYMHAIADAAVTGCRVILPDRFDSGVLLEMLERERVSTLVTVPTIAIRLLADPRLDATDLSALRCYQSGGAKLPPQTATELEDRCDCQVLNMYGSLDVGIPTMTAPRTDPPDIRHHTVGTPVRGVELNVVAADGNPLPPGEVGEIAMRGPNTAIGYYADDEGTRRTFDAEGWGRFGDLGTIGADGRLRVVGRIKDVIIRGGRNISAGEIEEVARSHPAVVDAAAVATPDPELGERCVLFVVTHDAALDLAAVTSFLADRGVAKYKWPEHLVTVDELPQDAQGKAQVGAARVALRTLRHGGAMTLRTIGTTIPGVFPVRAYDPGEIRAAAEVADEHFDGLWTGDHLIFRCPILNPVVSLGSVALLTRRVCLGFGILHVTVREVIATAKALSTLDYLAGGRVLVGVGAGGEMPAEFAATGVPITQRGRRANESIEALRVLWQPGPASYAGKYLRFDDVALRPGPARPGGPPIWVGGRGKPALRRAARLGDAWFALFVTPHSLGRRRTFLAEEAERLGRPPVKTAFHLPTCLADSHRAATEALAGFYRGVSPAQDPYDFEPFWAAAGSTQQLVDRVGAFVEAGVEDVVLAPPGPDFLGQLARVAEAVPALRAAFGDRLTAGAT